MSFADAVAVASLHFALVGLLGTFFFASLSQWLGGILANQAAWKLLKDTDPTKKRFEARLECYYKAAEALSWSTGSAWVVITLFLGYLLLKLWGFLSSANQGDVDTIKEYVAWPCTFFFGLYLAVSLVFLISGYIKAKRIRDEAGDFS